MKMKSKLGSCLVLALVASAAMAPSALAERALGNTCHRDQVRAGATDTYHEIFVGRETALVTVSGDRDTDLDLYVYDEFGNLVGRDVDGTDQCVVVFTPRWTGTFTIRIVNRGGVYNAYTVCMG